MGKIKILIYIFLLILLFTSCYHIEIIKDEVDRNLHDEIKIVHISDLHIKKDKKIYKNLIEIINKIDPDILLITGDSIDNNKKLQLLNLLLSKLNKSIKKYAILGNHEYRGNVNITNLKEIYKENDTELLINNGNIFIIKEKNINLYGVDDNYPDIENFNFIDDSINIIMVHCPEYFDEISEKYKNKEIIVLSGHTHGGQITFFEKPILLPEGCGSYLKGKYIKNKLVLYVSKGIGNTVIDLRINAKPDIFYLILK